MKVLEVMEIIYVCIGSNTNIGSKVEILDIIKILEVMNMNISEMHVGINENVGRNRNIGSNGSIGGTCCK